MVTTSYPRTTDDISGIFVKRLAIAMADSGAKITVLAPGDSEAKSKELYKGLHIIRFNYAPRILMKLAYGSGGIPENLKKFPWLYFLVPFFLIAMAVNVLKLSKKCDIIHANWIFTALCSLPAAKLHKKKIAVTLRGSDLKYKDTKMFKWLLNSVDLVTSVNIKSTTDIRNLTGINVNYTPNGVDVPKTDFQCNKIPNLKDKICVAWVGNLTFNKGVDVLYKIASILLKMNPQIHFMIAGSGNSDEFDLDKLANISYIGSISPDTVFTLYNRCDLFLLTSRHEGRPNVLLEAMASGLPCVATNLPGVYEVLSTQCGIITKIEDPEAMAEAIYELTISPHKRKIMGEQAIKRIKELSLTWKNCADSYLGLFKRCV